MSRKNIAIIGGGSTALFCANILLENLNNIKIDIYERHASLGKKILASGNGRCNFTNKNISGKFYNNEVFVNEIFKQYSLEDTLDFFKKLGLIYKFDQEERAYPHSENASTILDLLTLNLLENNDVKLYLNTVVENIKINQKIKIITSEKSKEYDFAVLASGNIASNLAFKNNNNYLKNLNLKMSETKPSLVPLKTKGNFKDLNGVKFKGQVSLFGEGDFIYKEEGEVLFKKDGIGGIVVLQMSHYINKYKRKNYTIELDFVNKLSTEELNNYLDNKKNDLIKNIFLGLINKKIGERIIKELNIDENKKIETLTEENKKELINKLKKYQINIKDFYELEFAQVVSGGINLSEINTNLSLRKYPAIYAGGEILDVNGLCGGYNLQFAWSCGGVIAKDIIKFIKREITN